MKQQISRLVIGEGLDRALYEPKTKSYVRVRDTREDWGDTAAPRSVIEAFLKSRGGVREHLTASSAESPQDRGGLGAGVTFDDSLRHFQDDTAIYFYVVAPPTIGVQTGAQVLYLTSSNTANHGCEALLSFAADQEFQCVFAIWDWAHPDMPGGGKFVKSCSYDQLQQYLIPYKLPLDSGQELDTVCIFIANVTRRTNGDWFQNENLSTK